MAGSFREHAFLAGLRRGRSHRILKVPLGDDAALLEGSEGERLVASDTVVEGIHCPRGREAPEILARKAIRANLSDMAAMGGYGQAVLVNLVLPHGGAVEAAEVIMDVVRAECGRYDLALAGGDTVCGGDRLMVSVTVIGKLWGKRPICRSGARVGDLIMVTGALGGSILGHHHLFEPCLEESQRLVELGPPSAMADVSDGLLRDLANICTQSGCGAVIHDVDVPISDAARKLSARDPSRSALDHALHDGEDFELVLTVNPKIRAHLEEAWNMDRPLTVMGEIISEGLYLEQDGVRHVVSPGGFDHGEQA